MCDSTTTPAIAQLEWLRNDGPHFCGAECKDLFWDDAEHYINSEMWNKCACTLCVNEHDRLAVFGITPPTGGVPYEYPKTVGRCFHAPEPCFICTLRGSRAIPDADELVRKELIGDIHQLFTFNLPADRHNALVVSFIQRAPRPRGIPVHFFMLDNPTPCPCGRWCGSPATWWKDDDTADLCDCTGWGA